MPLSRKPKVAALPGVWPETASVDEVVHFASEKFPIFLLLFVAGEREHNDEHMIEDIRLMRGVVTKLDQFRRMKVRQWKQAAQTKPKGEETTT